MVILEDFLSENEARDMPEETLQAFVKIFGQELYKPLMDYLKNPEADQDIVAKLQDCVGSILVRNTFHQEVTSKGLKKTIYECRLKTLPDMVYNNEIDVDKLIEDLRWLEDNSGNLISTLPVRTKGMYENALALLIEYEKNPEYAHDNHIVDSVKRWKTVLFLPRKNVVKQTGMQNLSLNKNRWRMQLRAAEYLKYCRDNNISKEISREI